MTRLSQWLWIAIAAMAGAAYLAFSHFLTIAQHPSTLMLLLGATPLAVMALLAAWQSRWRWVVLSFFALVALTMVLYFEELRNHITWLYFMQHFGAMTLLAITFGSTLGRGDADALCSRITRLMLTGVADPVYMRFTWKVTLVWTVYFCTSAVISVVLFFFYPIDVWSYFANLLTPVFVGLLFVIEYLVRVRVLPQRAHFSIAQIIKTYRSYERH